MNWLSTSWEKTACFAQMCGQSSAERDPTRRTLPNWAATQTTILSNVNQKIRQLIEIPFWFNVSVAAIQQRTKAILYCAFICVGRLSYAQHFDEPTVMNQPYTQQVPDPFYGDYEGNYAPSETSVAEGGTAPIPAEA